MKKMIGLLLLLAAGCRTAQVAAPAGGAGMVTAGRLFSSLYQQRAAEYRALCYQAFNIARLRLDAALAQPHDRPLAIVTDIDETVLDNSPYDVRQALAGKEYDQASWQQWTAAARADTVPGGCSFLQYAATKGVQVFYITNRLAAEQAGTLANLQHFRFPDADAAHLILKTAASSKESRRQAVAEGYNIVLLLGDNLADFSALFDKKTEAERLAGTEAAAAAFGNRFIVLPNPVYGDWESALYQYNYGLTIPQKDSIIRAAAKSY
jgi:5'-nucleotidase (lipoprotein e(P4) family)